MGWKKSEGGKRLWENQMGWEQTGRCRGFAQQTWGSWCTCWDATWRTSCQCVYVGGFVFVCVPSCIDALPCLNMSPALFVLWGFICACGCVTISLLACAPAYQLSVPSVNRYQTCGVQNILTHLVPWKVFISLGLFHILWGHRHRLQCILYDQASQRALLWSDSKTPAIFKFSKC